MKQFEILGSALKVKMQGRHNDYSVTALYNCKKDDLQKSYPQERTYSVILYIDRFDVDRPLLTTKDEPFIIKANSKQIKFSISNLIEKLIKENYFETHIGNFELSEKAFDIGMADIDDAACLQIQRKKEEADSLC